MLLDWLFCVIVMLGRATKHASRNHQEKYLKNLAQNQRTDIPFSLEITNPYSLSYGLMSSIQLILSDDAQMLGHTQGAYDSEEAKHLASFTDPMP